MITPLGSEKIGAPSEEITRLKIFNRLLTNQATSEIEFGNSEKQDSEQTEDFDSQTLSLKPDHPFKRNHPSNMQQVLNKNQGQSKFFHNQRIPDSQEEYTEIVAIDEEPVVNESGGEDEISIVDDHKTNKLEHQNQQLTNEEGYKISFYSS